MKLKRVEISEDERAKLLAQHQQRVERYREEIERAASGQTAGAKFVDWQNPEWDVLESQAKSSDEGFGCVFAPWEVIGRTTRVRLPGESHVGHRQDALLAEQSVKLGRRVFTPRRRRDLAESGAVIASIQRKLPGP
jgi:hypothetical protein